MRHPIYTDGAFLGAALHDLVVIETGMVKLKTIS
jgi:hypothetical protein